METTAIPERMCPECGTTLHASATYCGCGWGRKGKGRTTQAPDPPVQCAYIACSIPATTRVKTKLGWANYCLQHYRDYHLARAEETCERLGLKTTAQKRAYVLEKLKAGVFRRIAISPPEREPGQDDEELVTAEDVPA